MDGVISGYIHQVQGPFAAGQNIIENIPLSSFQFLKIGISIDPYDLMPLGNMQGTTLAILHIDYNNTISKEIQIGKTGMYEIDEPMLIQKMFFKHNMPASTLIELVVY